ncbi:hypothetical protein AAC387_Pa08g1569 [Persea americana]
MRRGQKERFLGRPFLEIIPVDEYSSCSADFSIKLPKINIADFPANYAKQFHRELVSGGLSRCIPQYAKQEWTVEAPNRDYHKISEVDYDADKDATPSNDILLALVCNFLEIPKESLHFDSLSPNVD